MVPNTMDSGVAQETSQEKVSIYTTIWYYLYWEVVGSLLYLSTWTKPDIAHAVTQASTKTENLSKVDVIAVKEILKYLVDTKDTGIMFSLLSASLKCFSYSILWSLYNFVCFSKELYWPSGKIYYAYSRQLKVKKETTNSSIILAYC